MPDVNIDGVRYVPVSRKPNSLHINKLERVLASECPYLSKSTRNTIIKKFQADEIKPKETKPKTKTKKPKKYSASAFNYGNFKGFDEKGHILLKRGCRKHTSWTIHNVIDIQQWMKFGRKDKTTIENISEKVGLSETLVNQIVWNLKNGELSNWMDRWIAQTNIPQKSTPVENNPKKRKDLGWF